MTLNWIRAGLLAVVVLSGAMLANIFVFQSLEGGRGRGNGYGSAFSNGAEPGKGVAADWSMQMASRGSAPVDASGRAMSDSAELTRAVQRELQAKGYDTGGVDGIPGLVTRAAIMAYEADRAMPLTGEPGQTLLQSIVLGAAVARSADQAPVSEPSPQAQIVIKTVQRSLLGLGYAPGTADGRLGEDTIRAIRKFEAAQGMKESGRISGPLVARLARLAGPGQPATSP